MNPTPRVDWSKLGAEIDLSASVHETAVIMPGAKVRAGATIEANVIVGTEAEVGEGATLRVGTVVGNGARIGERCVMTEAEIGLNANIGADTVCEIAPGGYHRPHTNRTVGSLIERRREDDALNHVGTGDVREIRTLMVERRNDNSWSTQELVPGMEWDEAEAYCRWMNERDYPQRVYIGENVELGEGCRIEGAAMIGDDARLGDGVIVRDKAMVDNRADIACGAVIEPGAVVATRAQVPPGDTVPARAVRSRSRNVSSATPPNIGVGHQVPEPARAPAAAGAARDGDRRRLEGPAR